MEFAGAFMGHVGFDELKKHCKQGDEFCKEVLAILNERSVLEMNYAKSLKRLSQRLSKSCSGLMGSPLSTLWRTIFTEMDGEAEAHRKFSVALHDECVKPSAPVIDNLGKSRRNLELSVESASKIMSDRIMEHSKLKKRHHQLSKEKEAICDQLEGVRPKTKSDESKLAQKQSKTEVLLTRTDDEYYEVLLELQRKQTDWELASRNSCIKIQELERNKMDRLCRMGMSYSSLIANVSQQLSWSSDQIKKQSSNLDPDGEIRIVAQSRKTSKYQSEFVLCDYFCENFSNRIKKERRETGLVKPLEKFLGDLQKERAHHQGMVNLISAQSVRATEDEKLEMKQKLIGITSMLTFLEVNRSKLQKAMSVINEKQLNLHPLTSSIHQHFDKQGIMHSTVKVSIFDGADGENDNVFTSATHDEFASGNNYTPLQRSQSERPHTVDDIGVGKSAPRSRSFDKRGTLTAKQLQSLSFGAGYGRKLAPAPPVPLAAPTFYEESASSSLSQCVAKHPYRARLSDELTMQEGDVVTIHEKTENGWWKGELNGNFGLFPNTYVEVL